MQTQFFMSIQNSSIEKCRSLARLFNRFYTAGTNEHLDQGCPIRFQSWAEFHIKPWWVVKSCMHRILLQFLKFCPKIQVFPKKSLLKFPLIYRFLPQMPFSNLVEFFLITFIIARKLEIVAGPHQNIK